MQDIALETISCPYCGSSDYRQWAQERGFDAVRCDGCRLIFCNPRPALHAIDEAVRTGAHGPAAGYLDARAHRVARKVSIYRRVFRDLFADLWRAGRPVSWLDIGAGYGEVLQAVASLVPPGSAVMGVEPMRHKATSARQRGLQVAEDYLRPGSAQVRVASMVDVFSHVPDFAALLETVRTVLEPGGELFLETGNLADLDQRADFAGELGLPDHLVFAGESHVRGYLDRAGFEIVDVRRVRIDGLVDLTKNVVKKLIGRPAVLRMPYTSNYRQLRIRARLRS
jgi:SAM-dependent methyltransferase